jgi:hypothetical protein
VKDAPRVREVDGFRNGLHVARRARGGQRLVADELREVRPLDEVHRKVMLALMHADFVDGHDVRMLQTGRRRGLDAKPVDEFLTRILAQQQHLHRDDAVQALLPRLVNDAHAAPGDFLQQLVVAEVFQRAQRSRSRGRALGRKHLALGVRQFERPLQGAPGAKPFGPADRQRRGALRALS